MLDDFIKFTNKYSSIKKYKKKFDLKFLKKKFRNFNPEYFKKICDKSNEKKEIIINLDDELIKEYLKNYNTLKEYYISNCEKLLDLLDKELLEIEKVNEAQRFKFKNITEDELNSIEKKVRKLLSQIYFNCQKNYILGIKKLDKYFIEK